MLITAHRGASGLAPENTLSAIRKAMELGADYCEIDVQETADGIVILLHDDNLKKTTGVNKNIWEINYDTLKTLDAGSWLDPAFKGEPIPTLAQAIDVVAGRMKLNIELKINRQEKRLVESVLDLLEQKKFINDCILTSFDFARIQKVRRLRPEIKIGYIFSSLPQENVFDADCEVLSINKSLVTDYFIQKAHEHQKEVHVWTVNTPEEMQWLIRLEVDSIITNRPDLLHISIKK